jgi:hypothetical protein
LHRSGKGTARVGIAHVEVHVRAGDIRGDDVVASDTKPLDKSGSETAARAGDDSTRPDITGHQTAAATPLPSTTMPPSLTV